MTQLIALAIVIVLGLIACCALIAREDRQREPDTDRCDERSRLLRLEARQRAVRERMLREGVKPITTREWVSSAHEAPTLKRKATVLQIRKVK